MIRTQAWPKVTQEGSMALWDLRRGVRQVFIFCSPKHGVGFYVWRRRGFGGLSFR